MAKLSARRLPGCTPRGSARGSRCGCFRKTSGARGTRGERGLAQELVARMAPQLWRSGTAAGYVGDLLLPLVLDRWRLDPAEVATLSCVRHAQGCATVSAQELDSGASLGSSLRVLLACGWRAVGARCAQHLHSICLHLEIRLEAPQHLLQLPVAELGLLQRLPWQAGRPAAASKDDA
jgi:hypothetical protein